MFSLVVKFVISSAFSPHTHIKKTVYENAKANTNFRKNNLQTNVTNMIGVI